MYTFGPLVRALCFALSAAPLCAQHVPVIRLSQPALGSDSLVIVENGRLTVSGTVASTSDVVLFRINRDDVKVDANGNFSHTLQLGADMDRVVIGVGNKAMQRTLVRFFVRPSATDGTGLAEQVPVMSEPPVPEADGAVPPETTGAKGEAMKPQIVPYDPDAEEKAGTPLEIRALIVGVGQHQYSVDKNLAYPAKDALAMYDFLTSDIGLAADPKNVRLLVDQHATRGAILTALRDMMNAGNSTDLFFLYFSGHGVTTDNGQDYYFFTYDTQAKDQTSIVGSALSRTELLGKLGSGKVGKKVLFLDACYSGMMAQSGGKSMGERREHLFEEMAKTDEALVVFTSSSDTEQSYEDASLGGGHGIFTYYVVKGLQGDADRMHSGNSNGKVTVYELDRYLSVEVNARANALKDAPQRPKRNCQRCDDFPLSVTSEYDITTAIPKPVDQATITVAPVQGTPQVPIPVVSPTGKTYEAYKLPTPPKEIYAPAANPRVLNDQIYANAAGDKITFDRQHYANVQVTGVLGGRIISGKGVIKGIQIAFTDEVSTDVLKESFIVFSPDSSSVNVTLNHTSGLREKITLERMGVAKREPLLARRFISADGRTELCVHGIHYANVAVSGHVGNAIVDGKGELIGDVVLFVDERKDAYASGQLVLSDDWTAAHGVVAFGNGTNAGLDLTTSRPKAEYELDNAIYVNSTGDQTISFHDPHYATIHLSGVVGEENIACKGTVKGDVVSLNDEPKNERFRPSKLVLKARGAELKGQVIFMDGTVIGVNMVRAK